LTLHYLPLKRGIIMAQFAGLIDIAVIFLAWF